MHYSKQQMIRFQICDLITDYRCAVRDSHINGMHEYGLTCKRRAIELFRKRHSATIGKYGQAQI